MIRLENQGKSVGTHVATVKLEWHFAVHTLTTAKSYKRRTEHKAQQDRNRPRHSNLFVHMSCACLYRHVYSCVCYCTVSVRVCMCMRYFSLKFIRAIIARAPCANTVMPLSTSMDARTK